MNISKLYAAPLFCRSSRTWSHSWSWCFFCEHCLRRGDGSWKSQSWTIPHLLLYFSIDKMNIEMSKYHNPFVALEWSYLYYIDGNLKCTHAGWLLVGEPTAGTQWGYIQDERTTFCQWNATAICLSGLG